MYHRSCLPLTNIVLSSSLSRLSSLSVPSPLPLSPSLSPAHAGLAGVLDPESMITAADREMLSVWILPLLIKTANIFQAHVFHDSPGSLPKLKRRAMVSTIISAIRCIDLCSIDSKHSMLTSARYATMYSQILSAMLSSDGGKTAAVAEDDSIDARAVWGGMRHAALTSLETLQYEATTFVMF